MKHITSSLFPDIKDALTFTLLPFGHIRASHLQLLQELVKEYPWLKWDGTMSFGESSTTPLQSSLTGFSHYAEVLKQYEENILREYHAKSVGKLHLYHAHCSMVNMVPTQRTSSLKRRIDQTSFPPPRVSSDGIEKVISFEEDDGWGPDTSGNGMELSNISDIPPLVKQLVARSGYHKDLQ